MDLRPQAHDIIRTWLFSTVLRSELEHGSLPWKNAAISGWVLDPDRKKMSKSKGNVVTPMGLLDEHGSDGVRYWAASGRPGTDTAFDTGQMKVGRRLAIKLLNASRFVLSRPEPRGVVTAARRSRAAHLARASGAATRPTDLDGYNYARALERTETFFWSFCDDYLELVKGRRYGDQGAGRAASANGALLAALSTMLRLFAPFLPFVTEEVWSWWQAGSVHRAPWPTAEELLAACAPAVEDERGVQALEFAAAVLGEIRKKKSEEQRPLKTRVSRAAILAPAGQLALLADVEQDLRRIGADRSTRVGRRRHAAGRRRAVAGLCPCRMAADDRGAVRPARPGRLPGIVRRALAEDVGSGDVTTEGTVPPRQRARGELRAKAPCVIAGIDVALEVFRQLDPAVGVQVHHADGGLCAPGDVVATLQGWAGKLLTAERTALNFLQRLSGIATLTRRFVDAAGGRITILDTQEDDPDIAGSRAIRGSGGRRDESSGRPRRRRS